MSASVSDELLLKRISEGSKAAMHIFFARHRVAVIDSIQRVVRDPAIANDLVGHVFLDIWRTARRFGDRSRISIWLFQIACFKATSTRRMQLCDKDDVFLIANAEGPNNIFQACVDGLSPAHREVIEMVYFRKRTIAEPSEVVACAAMRGRLFYARKQLARMLAGACVTSASN